jgi:hypothetical protein
MQHPQLSAHAALTPSGLYPEALKEGTTPCKKCQYLIFKKSAIYSDINFLYVSDFLKPLK